MDSSGVQPSNSPAQPNTIQGYSYQRKYSPAAYTSRGHCASSCRAYRSSLRILFHDPVLSLQSRNSASVFHKVLFPPLIPQPGALQLSLAVGMKGQMIHGNDWSSVGHHLYEEQWFIKYKIRMTEINCCYMMMKCWNRKVSFQYVMWCFTHGNLFQWLSEIWSVRFVLLSSAFPL